ncbi:MAG: ATP-binding protein, partial [Chitinophagaceae bacterium]
SRRLYEVEIKELENQIHELKSAATRGAHHLERLDYEQKALQQRWENEVRSIEIEADATLEKFQTEIAETKTLLADLENKLSTEDTFCLWLNKNIENWQQHIGKVSSQDILFNNQLSPAIVPGSSDFFGVRIDLDAIESQAKTPMDLVAEKLQLEAQLTELDKNFQHTNQDKQDRLERLRRKYQPLIKGIKDPGRARHY